jgi:serine/threonine-protein kinase
MRDDGSALALDPGEIIDGRFRIVRVLGRGGSSVVYAATDGTTSRSVAVKVLRARDVVTEERLLREARALSALRNEHMTRFVHCGTLASHEPYLVTELAEGKDLRLLLQQRGAFPVRQALDIVLQLCDVLAEAHGQGIVHRDIKPGNVIAAAGADGSLEVKLCDFGVSRLMSPDAGTRITNTDELLGTPHYMAPEQIQSAHDADARADIYSVGALLYRLVTDEYPFDGKTAAEVIVNIANMPTPSLLERCPGAPASVDAIVRRCLAKSPEDRVQSAAELAELVRVTLEEPSVAATEPLVARRLPRREAAVPAREAVRAPRRRLRGPAIAVVGVLVAAGAGWIVLGAARATSSSSPSSPSSSSTPASPASHAPLEEPRPPVLSTPQEEPAPSSSGAPSASKKGREAPSRSATPRTKPPPSTAPASPSPSRSGSVDPFGHL